MAYESQMQKADEQINYEFRIRLQEEFSRRLRVNSRYSIRSFSKQLGLHSSTLSKILAGTRRLSEIKIEELGLKLGFNLSIKKEISDLTHIEHDAFTIISDWYHFAILDLTLLDDFKSNINWIAKKLDISTFEASSAVARLRRLGLLVEESGRLKKSKAYFTNYTEGETSLAHKEYQRQVVNKALLAIDNCAQEKKDITSITIAADSKKIKLVKAKIKKFRHDLCAFLENGNRNTVYHFSLQLYPVTKETD